MRRWTIKQLSERLNVPRSTLRRWVRQGRIPYERLSPKSVRFDPDAVEAWLRERRCQGTR